MNENSIAIIFILCATILFMSCMGDPDLIDALVHVLMKD